MDEKDKLIRQLGDALLSLTGALDKAGVMVPFGHMTSVNGAQNSAREAIQARSTWESTQPQESFS